MEKYNFGARGNRIRYFKFLAKVSNYKNAMRENPFYDLETVVRSILTIPHSKAEVESTFLLLNLVKSKLHNRMEGELLNVLQVKYSLKNGKFRTTYDISEDAVKSVGKSVSYSAVFIEPTESSYNPDDLLQLS